MGARGSDAPSVPSLIFHMRYFPFLSFGFSYSFRGRNVPKEGGFCNTRSRVRCTVHGTVEAYTNTKCHIVIFWRCNDNLVNPECCNIIRVQLSFSKKG